MAKKKETVIVNVDEYRFEDLPKALGRIGDLQREKNEIQNDYDTRIAALQTELAGKVEFLDKEIQRISQSIKFFMDENKNKYISDNQKTLNLETGDISYRKGKQSVKTRTSDKLIDGILERNGLIKSRDTFWKKLKSVYLRGKIELDKEAILQSPLDAIAVTGVEIADGGERFYLKPYSTSTELEVQ
jgi:phage host-nuclease inhibitor protein Gam